MKMLSLGIFTFRKLEPVEKKLYVACGLPQANGVRETYYFRADDIGKVHQAARAEFGPGKSFSTREANQEDRDAAALYHIQDLK